MNSSKSEIITAQTRAGFVERLNELMPQLCRAMVRYERNYLTSGLLTLPQLWALEIVQAQGPTSMQHLASALQLKSSSATLLVDRLEGMGLVLRRKEKTDRRVVKVVLASRGRRVLREIDRQKKAGIQRVFKPLTTRERSQYLQLIRKMALALADTEPVRSRKGRT